MAASVCVVKRPGESQTGTILMKSVDAGGLPTAQQDKQDVSSESKHVPLGPDETFD